MLSLCCERRGVRDQTTRCQAPSCIRLIILIALIAAGIAAGSETSAKDAAKSNDRTATPRGSDSIQIASQPVEIKRGAPLSDRALVARPLTIPGAMSWTLETRRHRGYLYCFAVSPDGQQIATGGIDGTIRLWEFETGKFIKALMGHNSYISRLSWSPDGNTLASAGTHDATARLWDIETGQLLRTYRNPKGYVSLVTWSPEGKRVAFGGADSGYVYVYDVVLGVEMSKVSQGVPLQGLHWSPDGEFLGFVGAQIPVNLWELAADKPNKFLDTSGDASYGFSWSKDGKTVAVAGAKGIRFYDFDSTSVQRTIESPSNIVAYSPDGATLASAAPNGLITLWEAASGKEIKVLTGSVATFLTWTPDSSQIVAGTNTACVVWDVATGKSVRSLDVCGIHPPVWHPGKPMISGMNTPTPFVWDATTGKPLCTLEGHTGAVLSVAWTKDGKTLATGATDGTVKLWEMPSGTLLASLEGHKGAVYVVDWNLDGKTLASASADKTIRVWKAPDKKPAAKRPPAGKTDEKPAEGETAAAKPATSRVDEALLQTFAGHEGPVTELAWAPKGNLLATGSTDKSVRIWNAGIGKPITKMDVGAPVYAVAWSPDAKVVASSGVDDKLNFWNPTNGQVMHSLENKGSPPWVSTLAWSPTGAMLASGRHNHTLQLWDGRTSKLNRSLPAMAPVISATWTPGASTIAGGCYDRTVRFWDAATGNLRGHLIAEDKCVVVVSADGFFRAEPGIESDLFYVIQTEKAQETLTISDFVTRTKLKNNPAQARIMGN